MSVCIIPVVSTSSTLSNVHETINVFDQLARKLQTGFVPGMDDAQPACVLALLELH